MNIPIIVGSVVGGSRTIYLNMIVERMGMIYLGVNNGWHWTFTPDYGLCRILEAVLNDMEKASDFYDES